MYIYFFSYYVLLLFYSKFDVILENLHIIGEEQIWAAVFKTGPTNTPLTSAYKTRNSPEYKAELGNAIGKNCGLSIRRMPCLF
jgi:hypothetical protein